VLTIRVTEATWHQNGVQTFTVNLPRSNLDNDMRRDTREPIMLVVLRKGILTATLKELMTCNLRNHLTMRMDHKHGNSTAIWTLSNVTGQKSAWLDSKIDAIDQGLGDRLASRLRNITDELLDANEWQANGTSLRTWGQIFDVLFPPHIG
jgi:hypothetical protein